MRPMIIAVCVCAVGCGGQGAISPTAPTNATAAPTVLGQGPESGAAAGAGAQSRGQQPLRGTFEGATVGVGNCPPTCPPTSLRVTGTAAGEATLLGRFTVAIGDVIDVAAKTGVGTRHFTAANGDRLSMTTVGAETEFVPPNVSHASVTATIVGGTGRFAGASGVLTIRETQTIDFANGHATISGTFDGHLTVTH